MLIFFFLTVANFAMGFLDLLLMQMREFLKIIMQLVISQEDGSTGFLFGFSHLLIEFSMC